MSDSPGGTDNLGLSAALATLQGLLTSGETLEAWAAQRRLYALKNRRVLIAATSGRFISLKRRLFGGYDSADIRWQDLKETRISAGLIAADLILIAQSSSDLNIGAGCAKRARCSRPSSSAIRNSKRSRPKSFPVSKASSPTGTQSSCCAIDSRDRCAAAARGTAWRARRTLSPRAPAATPAFD